MTNSDSPFILISVSFIEALNIRPKTLWQPLKFSLKRMQGVDLTRERCKEISMRQLKEES